MVEGVRQLTMGLGIWALLCHRLASWRRALDGGELMEELASWQVEVRQLAELTRSGPELTS